MPDRADALPGGEGGALLRRRVLRPPHGASTEAFRQARERYEQVIRGVQRSVSPPHPKFMKPVCEQYQVREEE